MLFVSLAYRGSHEDSRATTNAKGEQLFRVLPFIPFAGVAELEYAVASKATAL